MASQVVLGESCYENIEKYEEVTFLKSSSQLKSYKFIQKVSHQTFDFFKNQFSAKVPLHFEYFPTFGKSTKKGNIGMKWANPLSAKPTKWSNTLKQVVGSCRRIVWVCLTILWGGRLKE